MVKVDWELTWLGLKLVMWKEEELGVRAQDGAEKKESEWFSHTFCFLSLSLLLIPSYCL